MVEKEKQYSISKKKNSLTLSWWWSPSYRKQSIDFQSKPVDWFLYDRDLRHEIVKTTIFNYIAILKLHLWNILEQQYIHRSTKMVLSTKFHEKLERYLWSNFITFIFSCKSKVAWWRTAFLLILSSFKDVFQGLCCCQEFVTIFWRLGKHLFGWTPPDDSSCMDTFLVNVRAALFSKQTKNSPSYRKNLFTESVKKS